MTKLIVDRRYWLIPLLFWTLLVSLSLAWNWDDVVRHQHELATNRARFIFKMVESVRLWNARHGGLYALIDEQTQPNPLLEVEEREITTPSGRQLTLVNPAYMTRQLGDVVNEVAGVLIHITSLNPVNPDNRAMPWEAEALERFARDRNLGEWSSFTVDEQGEQRFRYIAPLVTRKPCLQCHEKQGYKVGDIRGGISVTLPPDPLLNPVGAQLRKLIGIHVAVLLLLCGLSLFYLSRQRRHILALQQARDEQEQLVEQRTAEWREEAHKHKQAKEQLHRFIESSGEGIVVVDREGHFTLGNPAALEILGYAEETPLKGRNIHDLICPYGGMQHCRQLNDCSVYRSYHNGEKGHEEGMPLRRADGTTVQVDMHANPLEEDGQIKGAVLTFSDISERIEHTRQLRKLSKALEFSPVAALITDAEGRIEYVNRRFIEESGYSKEELLGEKPSLMKSGKTAAETYRYMWQQLLRGQPWHGELLNRRKNGELFWDDTSIAPITDETGKVVNFVAFKEDVTQRKEHQKKVWKQANYDGLTGLPNRHHFLHQLRQRLHESRRYERKLALLFIDLDGFKQVNDRLGHDAGDDLLRLCAERLTLSVRDTDIVSRLGGDEFTVIIPQFSGCHDIDKVAEKLIRVLSQPYVVKAETVQISASMGIAAYPHDADDETTLINMADTAMYAAKRNGKNQFMYYAATSVEEREQQGERGE